MFFLSANVTTQTKAQTTTEFELVESIEELFKIHQTIYYIAYANTYFFVISSTLEYYLSKKLDLIGYLGLLL